MITTAYIYQPAKNAMQSGKGNTQHWVLEYEAPAPGIPDALMGWNSQPDTITQVKLRFPSKEDAVAYAIAKNLTFHVTDPQTAVIPPKTYSENFSNKRRTAFDESA